MSALAVEALPVTDGMALDGAAPWVRLPVRPTLVLVPTGPRVGASAGLRPTRFGRLLATLSATVVLAAGIWLASGAWGSAVPAPRTVTVQPGQTLSEIAAHELPSLPIVNAVTRIQLANGMSSAGVDAGQVLAIPAAG